MRILWLLMIFVSPGIAAEVRILNLSGTNVVLTLTNGPALTVPPGEVQMNVESGTWYVSGGGSFEVADSDYLEVWRFSDFGGLQLDRSYEPPLVDVAISGFITGLTIFGFAWMVSGIVSGLHLGGFRGSYTTD